MYFFSDLTECKIASLGSRFCAMSPEDSRWLWWWLWEKTVRD